MHVRALALVLLAAWSSGCGDDAPQETVECVPEAPEAHGLEARETLVCRPVLPPGEELQDLGPP